MAAQRVSNEDILAAVRESGSVRAAAKALGMAHSSVRERFQKLEKAVQEDDTELGFASSKGLLGTEPVLPGYALKRSTAVYGKEGELVREYVTQAKAPGRIAEIPAGHLVKGYSILKDGQGRVTQEWVKTRIDPGAVDVVAAIKSVFDQYRGRATLAPPPVDTDQDLMSVYVLTDVHHGLLAWSKEAGEDYDISIGSERLRTCMRDLVSMAPRSSEALILNLGDYFHNNDQRNVTPGSGHQLDVDSRYFKVAMTGVTLFQDVIELALAKHDTVRVRCLRGNHDPEASVALQIALAAFYHANPRVTVELDPADMFFHRFGATLIGACHGDRMKPDRMAMSMAMLRPQDWGASRFRWFLFGHIHHESVKEVGNVRCESFQTICAKDAYAAAHGYLAGQSLNSVTLHRERGEIGRHRVNVMPVQ